MPNHIHGTIGSIIHGYKIGVTNWFCNNYPNNHPVAKSIWQHNYWENIICDETGYICIAKYIINNPAKWNYYRLNDNL